MQSDMDFLRKLGANFGKGKDKWEFYACPGPTADILRFRPRSQANEVAALKWGADLLSFKPEANLGNQISRVEVHGWDEVRKAPILGQASAEGGAKGQTAGEIQRGFLAQEVVRELRLPVRSKQEADDRAAAELAKTIFDHLKGEGETFGLPALVPDTRVRLDGLGAKFSRSFYVTKTTHRYDASGYRTRFAIEEPDS
jgi:phage protein D